MSACARLARQVAPGRASVEDIFVATTPTSPRDRLLLEGARQACLEAAMSAYEDGGIRGLCGDGRWEYALAAMRAVDLASVPASLRPRPDDDEAPGVSPTSGIDDDTRG